jgi:hypothetical protein
MCRGTYPFAGHLYIFRGRRGDLVKILWHVGIGVPIALEPRAGRPTAITLGADKAYDAEDFVNELRSMNVTPHVAQNTSGRSSAIDGRTTRHSGYAASQRIRKRIEEAFGWIFSGNSFCISKPRESTNRRKQDKAIS